MRVEEIVEKLKSLELREVLGYAIASEIAARDYYNALARQLEGLPSERFKSLAKDEEIHWKILSNLHKKLFGDTTYKVPEGLPPLESTVKLENAATLITALETAMLNEHVAWKVYSNLAEKHKEHSAVFKYLAMMEKSHYESLKMEKELYEGTVEEHPELKGEAPLLFCQRFA